MSRRNKGRNVHGIVLLDKPPGYSSNQALQKVRWLFDARKAGHTGSLDPFATGMLPICLGEASKTAGLMLDASKTYLARAWLGTSTSTGDIEGDVTREMPVPELDEEQIKAVFAQFHGDIEQVPPMYSALKHEGQPLYKLARAGKKVERKARTVSVHSLELSRWDSPVLEFRVHCSKGTYVRTLAEDIAEKLGCCAHLQALHRLRVEPFEEQDMKSLAELESRAEDETIDSCLLPVDAGLTDWPRVTLEENEETRFSHGNPIPNTPGLPGPVRVYGPGDHLLGLGEILPDQSLKPRRIMHLHG
ncbi:MAG: tRNA pseudouridine(55) synthase TruB [Gammaproteobacteria bacterium]|jgi:tRNA pseudouridine55 synthase|nr:tRNA pseudouridine(55) synthase TruB [Gammaproteobacteria bacterium]